MSLELVCPAGNLPALKTAVDNGADCVYFGFRNATNARAFAGLNFDADSARLGIRYAREHGRKVLLALNTFPQTTQWQTWRQALHGKRIAIHVTDAGLRLHFTVNPNGFAPTDAHGTPDLAFSATLHDFGLLATRKEDPDTLFFNRRLLVEGDTELGLVAKNTLDSIELPKLADFRPDRVLGRLLN